MGCVNKRGVEFVGMVAAVAKPRRKLNLSPEERQRRTDQILGWASIGGQARNAKVTPEKQFEYSSKGGKARIANYNRLKSLMIPESPESVRKRRMELEAKREAILDALVESAEADGAEVSVVSAALRELRTEADRLIDREARAKAEQAQQAAAGPARAALVPAPPAALLAIPPAALAADPAPESPGLAVD
jgi:hypothetical protein